MVAIDTGTTELLADLSDRVLTLTLNRPEARNALSPEMMFALRRLISEFGDHADVGALLLTGAGGAFSSGGDVKRMAVRKDGEQTAEAKFQEMFARHSESAGAIRKLRIPTIAAIPGPAAGAGMALALSCDLRVMAEEAFFTTGYARVGLPGDYGASWLLTRIVGPGKARELMLLCPRTTAVEALSLGLANRVVKLADLQQRSREIAVGLASGPRIAYRYIKDNLDEALDIDHATAIDHEAARMLRAQSTADHKEAARAFVEKRSPKFKGS